MKRSLAPFLSLLALLGSVSFLAGCNTTAGLGQDVSATGHIVTHAADDVKDKL